MSATAASPGRTDLPNLPFKLFITGASFFGLLGSSAALYRYRAHFHQLRLVHTLPLITQKNKLTAGSSLPPHTSFVILPPGRKGSPWVVGGRRFLQCSHNSTPLFQCSHNSTATLQCSHLTPLEETFIAARPRALLLPCAAVRQHKAACMSACALWQSGGGTAAPLISVGGATRRRSSPCSATRLGYGYGWVHR